MPPRVRLTVPLRGTVLPDRSELPAADQSASSLTLNCGNVSGCILPNLWMNQQVGYPRLEAASRSTFPPRYLTGISFSEIRRKSQKRGLQPSRTRVPAPLISLATLFARYGFQVAFENDEGLFSQKE